MGSIAGSEGEAEVVERLSRPLGGPSTWAGLLRDPAAIVGIGLVAVVVMAGILGPLLAPYSPNETHLSDRLVGPQRAYLLGTDELGRDLLSRALWGSRVSLYVAVTSVTLAACIGVTLGMTSGYFGGRLDHLLMRSMDLIFAFPGVLLAMVVVAVLGVGVGKLITALVIVYVPVLARIARGATLAVRRELYIQAEEALGLRARTIIRAHVLPNILTPVLIMFTLVLADAIIVEATLSFLGLGIQPPTASWGNMLADGRSFMELSPWVVLVPGSALIISVLGLNLVGDSLRDVLDPRL
jgi:peptide/nickel transport system permease protein